MPTELLIAAPKLEKFVDIEKLPCAKCGTRVSWYERQLSTLKGGVACCFSISYCPGGKEPTETLSPLQAMTTGRSEVHIPCAGVLAEHLHAKCRCCGHTVLMETRGGEQV